MLVKTTLDIPEDVYAQYESQTRGSTVDSVISKRLAKCASHTASKPIYLDDDDRQELERMLGRNFSSAADLIDTIKRLVTVSVSNVEVSLPPTLLQRLRTRCFGVPFDKFVADRVVSGLEDYTMMG